MILIEYNEVDIGYEHNVVLRNINFKLYEGQFVFIKGKVGVGKTTFLRSIYADVDYFRGKKANVLGFNLLKLKRRDIPKLRRKIGYVFQDFKLLTDRNVYKNLEFVLRATGWTNDLKIKRRIEKVLKDIDMLDYINAMPSELSGGQTQKIAIARALLNEPPLILADEPTGNLDFETGLQILQILYELVNKGISVITVTHNLLWLNHFENSIQYEIKDGQIYLLKAS